MGEKGIFEPIGGWKVVWYHFQNFEGILGSFPNTIKEFTKIQEVHDISDDEKVVHNTTRIQEHNNNNRVMQTSSQRSTNLMEDLS